MICGFCETQIHRDQWKEYVHPDNQYTCYPGSMSVAIPKEFMNVQAKSRKVTKDRRILEGTQNSTDNGRVSMGLRTRNRQRRNSTTSPPGKLPRTTEEDSCSKKASIVNQNPLNLLCMKIA